MSDSLMLAKLSLMLLRASVQHPESLPPDYGVLVSPSTEVLGQSEALSRLAVMGGELQIHGKPEGRNLLISARKPTDAERKELEVTAATFVATIHEQNKSGDPEALVRVVGFREQTVVPARVAEEWLSRVSCSDCSMGIGVPGPQDQPPIVAVLYLGRRR